MNYVTGNADAYPDAAEAVANETAEAFELTTGVNIEIGTASFKTSRGYTYAAVLADELAFWPTDDSAEPDYAILMLSAPA